MNRKNRFRNFVLACLTGSVILFSQGCYYDKEELLYPGSTQVIDCTNVQPSFSGEVSNLVTTKCAISGCHNTASQMGGKVFGNYAQILPDTGRIWIRAVKVRDMPPTGPLQPAELKLLNCWIRSGAANN